MTRRLFLLAASLIVASATAAADPATDDAAASAEWRQLRPVLFGDRPIAAASPEVLTLEAPVRAEDAATVPIAIRSRVEQTATRYVKTAYLIIDRNPSPVAATFRLTPESGRADLETRVRVEQYSFIRAIVELNDGSLHMATRFVKASGGCSAPAGKDPAAAAANLGRMKLRAIETGAAGEPVRVQLMISHPNTSGLAMDQVSRSFPAPHFVRLVTVRYRDKPVLVGEIDFSISENPNFRFYIRPEDGGELQAEVEDTAGRKFESRITIGAGGGS
jgi:sulfur-oxidizing protein SoxY